MTCACGFNQSNNELFTALHWLHCIAMPVPGHDMSQCHMKGLNKYICRAIMTSQILYYWMSVSCPTFGNNSDCWCTGKLWLGACTTDWVPLLVRSCMRREGGKSVCYQDISWSPLCSWHWLLGSTPDQCWYSLTQAFPNSRVYRLIHCGDIYLYYCIIKSCREILSVVTGSGTGWTLLVVI